MSWMGLVAVDSRFVTVCTTGAVPGFEGFSVACQQKLISSTHCTQMLRVQTCSRSSLHAIVSARLTTPSILAATLARYETSKVHGFPRPCNHVLTSSRANRQSCCSKSNCEVKQSRNAALSAVISTHLWFCKTTADGQYTRCQNAFSEDRP
jgi:hypothetical protein